MSTFIYNGVSLGCVKTRSFQQIPIYTDDGSEYLYTKYYISVSAIYNPASTSYTRDGYEYGIPPAQTDKAIRFALAQPRGRLFYSDGQNVILESPAQGSEVDAVNGPSPKGVVVREIVGTKTWHVDFSIETCVSECARISGAPAIANRWNRRHSIDSQAMTTCITNGIAVFRMDALQLEASKNADHFRNIVVPGVPPGFRRVSLDVAVSTVGNVIQYTVVDQEQFHDLGDSVTSLHPDVVSFEATYAQSTVPAPGSNMPGAHIVATLNVGVVGRKSSLRQNLIAFAIAVAIEKLEIEAGAKIDPLKNGLITQIMLSEQLHGRAINLSMQALFAAGKRGKAGTMGLRTEFFYNNGDLGVFTNDGTNPQFPNDSNTRGTYTGEIFATELRRACALVRAEKVNGIKPGSKSTNVIVEPSLGEQSLGTPVPEIGNKVSMTDGEGFYTDYKIESTFARNEHILMSPVSSVPGRSSSSSSAGNGDGRAEFMTVANPTSVRVVRWTAEKVGGQPKIPTAKSNDPNYVLLKSHVTPTSPILAPELQTYVYRTSGRYIFGCKTPMGADDELPVCLAPWIEDTGEAQAILAHHYSHGIIDPYEPMSPGDEPAEDGGMT